MAERPTNKPKRRVVKNPDSFRERAQKATEASVKPKRTGRFRSAAAKAFKPVIGTLKGSALGKVIAKFFGGIAKVFNFITRSYFVNSWRELKQVTWPSWKQSRQLTFAVLVFAIIFGASIALVDYGLEKLFRNILLK